MLTLRRLNPGYRLLYTGVLLFMTLGTVVHAVHQHVRVGLSPGALAAWYLGNADDPDAAVMLFPRSFEEVFGDVWLHASTYTLAFVVFAAILFRSGAVAWLRALLLLLYALGGLCAAAAPLLIRYADPLFAWPLAAALLVLPWVGAAMTLVAAEEMWRGGGAGGVRVDPRPV